MCRPASIVLTRNAAFWSLHTDSHTEIIVEDGAHGPNVCKIEITPPDERRLDSDPDTWRYKVDQDITPEWYDHEDGERRARAALAKWIEARVHVDYEGGLGPGTHWVYGESSVHCGRNCYAIVYDSGSAVATLNAELVLCDDAVATLHDHSYAAAHGRSRVEAFAHSRADLHGQSTGEADDAAVINAWHSARVSKATGAAVIRSQSCHLGELPEPFGYAVVIDHNRAFGSTPTVKTREGVLQPAEPVGVSDD